MKDTKLVYWAVASGVVANLALGASSLYWRLLSQVSTLTLLSYRILLSLLALCIACSWPTQLRTVRTNLTVRNAIIHTSAAALVALNWGAFIWASTHGHVVESGFGYLIAPFVSVACGALIFGELLSLRQRFALALIAATVATMIARSGELNHWVYIVIGLAWGGYACLKKLTKLNALSGLLYETAALSLPLLPTIMSSRSLLQLPPELSSGTRAILAACGVVSVLPLVLFAVAARRLPLASMGLIQFVLPSTQFVVALGIYRQPVSEITLVGFTVVWLVIALIGVQTVLESRARNRMENIA